MSDQNVTIRQANAVTADLAVQQENEGLRLALREQERIVEQLTNECRRLEDRLEDRYQDIDALRRELDHRDRLVKQLETRLNVDPALASSSSTLQSESPSPALDTAVVTPTPRVMPLFLGGFVAGALISGFSVGIITWQGRINHSFSPQVTHDTEQTIIPAASSSLQPVDSSSQSENAALLTMPVGAPSSESPTPFTSEESMVVIPVHPDQPLFSGPVVDVNGLEMMRINAVKFSMGNPLGMSDSDARPVHNVTLKPYFIGTKEVTFAQYDEFVHATGARRPNDFGWGRDARPVVDVSWDEARDYAQWLTKRTGKPYRLPSEAEWEYAARGGTTSSYWWGVGSIENRALCLDCGSRWDRQSTAPVASFDPNPFGLYDTAGNVYEWTADCYYYNYQPAHEDGRPYEIPNCKARVARGGSYNSPMTTLRSHARTRFAPETRIDRIGFRLARDVEDE
jgi:formylglycine-generating enzyme required for sulfatase activity